MVLSHSGWRRNFFGGGRQNLRFIALAGFLILVFLIGGGARADIQSLVLLRPIAAILCAFAILGLTREHFEGRKLLVAGAAALVALVAAQLIPLPPAIWQSLPGRELVMEIDRQAGIVGAWRPLTLSPTGTWNVLYSLLPPAAVLLLGLQMSREQLGKLAMVILALGLLSGIIGMLQAVGPAKGPLYFYRITNNGAAVGLFSNRNHQAMFLAALFPLLALYASRAADTAAQERFRAWGALICGAALIPLLLVTGSRAGLVLGAVSGAMSVFLYRPPAKLAATHKEQGSRRTAWMIVGAGGAMIALAGALMTRAEAFRRIAEGGVQDDLRFKVWQPILGIARDNFPVGTGFGSFPVVYQVIEPYGLLVPSYLNHVHNDWLELAVEAGLPGLLLAAFAAAGFAYKGVALLRSDDDASQSRLLGLLGAIVIGIFAIGSVADYPFRTPSIACFAVLAWLWMGNAKAPATLVEKQRNNSVRPG